jgi:hypothetical protein
MAPAPLTEANVRHLLRRTEFVDRPHRVAELLELADIDAAVANILAVDPAPPGWRCWSTGWARSAPTTSSWPRSPSNPRCEQSRTERHTVPGTV